MFRVQFRQRGAQTLSSDVRCGWLFRPCTLIFNVSDDENVFNQLKSSPLRQSLKVKICSNATCAWLPSPLRVLQKR